MYCTLACLKSEMYLISTESSDLLADVLYITEAYLGIPRPSFNRHATRSILFKWNWQKRTRRSNSTPPAKLIDVAFSEILNAGEWQAVRFEMVTKLLCRVGLFLEREEETEEEGKKKSFDLWLLSKQDSISR